MLGSPRTLNEVVDRMTEMLRVGFIGVGRIADMHYEGYRNNPRARLYAVCDVDADLVRRRAAEWGAEKTYDDYRRLLDDPAIDAVEIITPHHLHAEMSIAALDAGKHVSMQKPIALNVTEADAILAAADRSGRLFRVIENYRFSPPFSRAKQMIDAGEIGEPLSIRIKSLTGNVRYGWEVPPNSQDWRSDTARSGQGSVVFDHGQHIWSIARYFLGDVERAFALIGRERVQAHHELPPGALLDNPTMAVWKYRSADRYGSWEAVYADDMVIRSSYYPVYVWVEVTGARGVLWVNNFIGRKLNRPPLEMYRDGEMTGFAEVDPDYATSFSLAVGDFVDAVLEGRETELTGPEAREVLRFSLAILRSGEEGREVRVDEIVE